MSEALAGGSDPGIVYYGEAIELGRFYEDLRKQGFQPSSLGGAIPRELGALW